MGGNFSKRGRGFYKAQVSVFLLAGLIVLATAALLVFLMQEAPVNVDAPTDPVADYVQECLRTSAADAVRLLGQQAGYITVERSLAASALLDPFNSEYLAMYRGNLLLPYWYYQKPSGLDDTEMPPLHKSYDGDSSIEWQIEDYVSRQVENCTAGFLVFKDQKLDVRPQNSPAADASISDTAVSLELHYPLRIYRPDGTHYDMDEFFALLPVRLGFVYRLAKDIRDYEMDTVFLERNTMNLLTIYSRVDSDYLPPMYGGLEFKPCYERVFWVYPNVYEDMKEVLTANIPYLHVEGTSFEPVVALGDEQDMRQGIYTGMVHSVSEIPYEGARVNFLFRDSFPLELDFGGLGLLEPNSFEIDMLFAQVCMFEYMFGYNIKHPVLVEITDEKSIIDGRPYIFQYPMQVVIKDNFPRVRYSDVFGKNPESLVRSECDRKQYLSANVTLRIRDTSGRRPDNVMVYYQCGPKMSYAYNSDGSVANVSSFADECFIGQSTRGRFSSAFPQCHDGGIMTIKHENYLTQKQFIGPTVSEEKEMDIVLDPVYELALEVEKLPVKPPAESDPAAGVVLEDERVVACSPAQPAGNLANYEKAILRLTKLDPENGELPSPAISFYQPTEESTIRLARGTYQADIMLVRNEAYEGEMTIPRDSQEMTVPDGPMSEKTITYPDEDVLLPTVYTGGALFNWTVDEDVLAFGDTVVFTVFDEGPPLVVEDVGAPLGHRQRCSELNYARVLPRVEDGT